MDPAVGRWRALEDQVEASSPAPPPGRSRPDAAPLFLVGALLAGTIATILVLVLAAGNATPDVGVDRAGAVGAGATDRASGEPQVAGQAALGTEIVVEVAGAVAHPGLYRLAAGARAADAIAAAGGFGPRVDTGRAADLNLAAHVSDGDQIRVPSRDDPSAAPPAGSTSSTAPAGASPAGPLNLNVASREQLDALPGIGPVTADKIIAAREERPFASIDELVDRKVLGRATLEKIRALVAVR